MLKTWVIYSVSLISTFIFFLCYKMWVSWFCLIAMLMVPVFALVMCITASKTITFKTKNTGNCVKNDPAYIEIKTDGIATWFAFCKIKTVITDKMAGASREADYIIYDRGVTKIPVDTSHCGAYSYKMTKLKVYDLFGFFHSTLNIDKDSEIIVKPAPAMPDYMPDMYGFKARNLRKSNKPNSEIYDIRDYRAGDPLKSVHWKLSAKKEKLLVKEPLEEYGGHSRVILELTGDRDKLDLHLEQILFTSRFFIEHEVSHKIRVIPPDSRDISFDVESETDFDRALAMILRMRIPDDQALTENAHEN